MSPEAERVQHAAGVEGGDVVGGLLGRVARLFTPWVAFPRPLSREDRVRAGVILTWRVFAIVAVLTVIYPLDRLVGPISIPSHSRGYSPGMDFGGFYTGATIAWRADYEHLGDIATQRRVQREIQRRERTGWKWFNPLPHPPILSLITAPMASLRLRTAYWLWVVLSFAAAALAAYLLARTLTPPVPIATTLVLVSYEPLWHLLWWGQVDAFILLPLAAGCVLLLRARSRRDEVAGGFLMGFLALVPQYAVVPFLALAVARRWAALGMAACGGALALGSVVLVGREGVEHYLDMVERFGRFEGMNTVTEWAMFNVRGVVMRAGLDWSGDALLTLVWVVAIPLALLAIAAAGQALKPGQSPDLALGLIALAALVTAYHSHRQTLVFLFVLYAAFVGRSLRPGTPLWLTVGWILPVIGVHLWTVYLRNEIPIRVYPIQRYQMPVAIGLIVLLSLALLLPATARRLAGWPGSWSATAPETARPDERPSSALPVPAPGHALAPASSPESPS
jgi:hypothetical protein